MTHQRINLTTLLFLTGMLLFAQMGSAHGQIPADIGHWQIEQNIYETHYTKVAFYNKNMDKVYEERLEIYLGLTPYNVGLMDDLFMDFIERYERLDNVNNKFLKPVVKLKQLQWQLDPPARAYRKR